MNVKINISVYYGIYLAGFPIAGALVGVLFYFVSSLFSPGVSGSFFLISVVLWAAFGLFAGIISLKRILKVEAQLKSANGAVES
jgi:hypothetical protein